MAAVASACGSSLVGACITGPPCQATFHLAGAEMVEAALTHALVRLVARLRECLAEHSPASCEPHGRPADGPVRAAGHKELRDAAGRVPRVWQGRPAGPHRHRGHVRGAGARLCGLCHGCARLCTFSCLVSVCPAVNARIPLPVLSRLPVRLMTSGRVGCGLSWTWQGG